MSAAHAGGRANAIPVGNSPLPPPGASTPPERALKSMAASPGLVYDGSGSSWSSLTTGIFTGLLERGRTNGWRGLRGCDEVDATPGIHLDRGIL